MRLKTRPRSATEVADFEPYEDCWNIVLTHRTVKLHGIFSA